VSTLTQESAMGGGGGYLHRDGRTKKDVYLYFRSKKKKRGRKNPTSSQGRTVGPDARMDALPRAEDEEKKKGLLRPERDEERKKKESRPHLRMLG